MAINSIYQVRTIEVAPPQAFNNVTFNINTYVDNGEYAIPNNSSITNLPVTGLSGVLKVIKMEGFGVNLILQYFFGSNIDQRSVSIYSRSSSNGGSSWGTWEKYIKASGDTFTGAIATQNITTTGTIIASGNIRGASLNTTGAATIGTTLTIGGALTLGGSLTITNGGVTASGILRGSDAYITNAVTAASGAFTGNISCQFLNGTAYRSQLADLAEKYSCLDKNLPVGTVIEISESEKYEMQQCNYRDSEFIWGVVSSEETASILMNDVDMDNPTMVALIGKVPVRIIGPVKKRDKITSYENGVAIVTTENDKNYFAISLETVVRKEEKLVMCLVGFYKRS